MLGFDALNAQPAGDESATPGSVPRPNADQVKFLFTGTACAPGATADFSWSPTGGAIVGNAAATLDLVAAATASHGVAGAAAAALDLVAAATGQHDTADRIGNAAATLDLVAAAAASHGIGGQAAATLDLVAAAAASHGIGGQAAATLDLVAAATASHGVAGAAAATLTLTASASAVHPRYEVRGQVQQQGVLLNRRVRVYARDSGALIGQADTAAGLFAIHTGFAPAEHLVIPVDLADNATDWAPPAANRVLSVLAQDA